jgi:hypothetical protein
MALEFRDINHHICVNDLFGDFPFDRQLPVDWSDGLATVNTFPDAGESPIIGFPPADRT